MDESKLFKSLGNIEGQMKLVVKNQETMKTDIKDISKELNNVENKNIKIETRLNEHIGNPALHHEPELMSRRKKIAIGTGTAGIISTILLIIADVISATGVD